MRRSQRTRPLAPALIYMGIDELVSRQNADGGWPYHHGSSWTEPTAYAVLALLAAGARTPATKGLGWLRAARRRDGGWPPRPGIDESSWVTALVALIPSSDLGGGMHDGAIRWLLATKGEESSWAYRLREWLLGNPVSPELEYPGWPWIPGAAAWVGPTSLAILALDNECRCGPGGSPEDSLVAAAQSRIAEGRKFLMRRMCREGGWNHGSVRALGYEAEPYPETTGMALAALGGQRSPELDRALAVARRFLDECRSADALNWLRLGLSAHGQLPAGFCPPSGIRYHTVPELALDLVVSEAGLRRKLLGTGAGQRATGRALAGALRDHS